MLEDVEDTPPGQGVLGEEQLDPAPPCVAGGVGRFGAIGFVAHAQSASETAPHPQRQAKAAGPATMRAISTGPTKVRIAIAM